MDFSRVVWSNSGYTNWEKIESLVFIKKGLTILDMKEEAYKQYMKEVDNWLHRGRRLLLETCLDLCLTGIKKGDESLKILEVGAGYGKNIEVLSKFGVVDAIEVEPIAIEILKTNELIHRLYSDKVPFSLDHTYDVISAMDFLEHVQNDKQVFHWMVEHLNPDGILFLTVPAYQFLFSYHDVAACHYRRYSLKKIKELNSGQLSVLKKGYFNSILFPFAAAIRLFGRMRKNINQSKRKQSSIVPLCLDRIFFYLLRREAGLISNYSLFPYGLTVYVLFKKCNR